MRGYRAKRTQTVAATQDEVISREQDEEDNGHDHVKVSTEMAKICNAREKDKKRKWALYMRDYRAKHKVTVVARRNEVTGSRREQDEDDDCNIVDNSSSNVAAIQKKQHLRAQYKRAFRASPKQRKEKESWRRGQEGLLRDLAESVLLNSISDDEILLLWKSSGCVRL
ncbi:hypothetical protein PHYPSEUDO_013660 [Phytophthora pseudosyringae]|uniref:Uncharacterized protein n=1 Tax=Phytophthora pseudosyringae TaxID=221518 RepID=A0A8T1V607_9STRA|nr:hypothetical protein PHYPSEUDO_013660 [Phytophthora pseudosyringae]